VALNDSPDDRQTNSGPLEFRLPMQPLKDTEKLPLILHIEADSIVAYEKGEFVRIDFIAADCNRGNNARARIFDGIGKEVGPDLSHQCRIGPDFWKRREVQIDGAATELVLETVESLPQRVIHINQGQLQIGSPQSGESQQMVD